MLLAQLGLIETNDEGQVVKRSAWCVAQGGSAFIYLLDNERREQLTKTLPDQLAEVEGVLGVVQPDQFAELGLADPAKNPEAPDLVLTTGPGYSFANDIQGQLVVDAGGSKGSHGHDPRPEYMHAMFVAAGKGIRAGVKLDVINNVDVAPTIAHLLGLPMKCDGRVLREALARP